MKMIASQLGCPTPVLHHLRPFTTTSSPSSTAVACMLVASEEATSGSVMQNAERISPPSSGCSQRCFCSSEPKCHNTSILPVSGALQLHTSAVIRERPMREAIAPTSLRHPSKWSAWALIYAGIPNRIARVVAPHIPAPLGVTLFYDAGCGVCSWLALRALCAAPLHTVRALPIDSDEAEPHMSALSDEARWASWHVLGEDGQLRSGGAAAPVLLQQ